MRSELRLALLVRKLLGGVLLVGGLLVAGCGERSSDGFLLPFAPSEGVVCEDGCGSLGFASADASRFSVVEVDHERRPAVVTGLDGWSWSGRVPAGGALRLGVQVVPGTAEGGEVALAVEARHDGRREILEVARLEPATAGWLDLAVDLSTYAGEKISLSASATRDAAGPPPDLAWGPISLFSADAGTAARDRPNVLVVVIDTLRADHLTPYGYSRDTSPAIQRLLADRGAVVETAYSQAPWTLPSAVSYMTGRYPNELLGGQLASYGIPEGVASLPERMQALGYRTGGFFANPTLHEGNGFARGFDTFYTPPPVNESMLRHADDISSRAIPWLAAHQHEPFFLYVHYLDPHDPYDNSDLEAGVSPFFPEYSGTLSGRWVHGVYTGQIPLEDPEQDVAHLTALYDSEIRYVDRHVDKLLATLEPEVLHNTLVVLTSDHGEELYDHGGWKHGQTLYQEQIHVPLLLRWDARIPPGTRLPGTAQLVDLLPSVLAAVGAAPTTEEVEAERLAGIDLLPALTGEAALPRRAAFAQHLASGPLRAASVFGGWKLILFNNTEPFVPEDALQEHLWSLDLSRLRRAELYDLESDPAELDDRLAVGPPVSALDAEGEERLAALDAVIDRHAAGSEGGLSVLVGEGLGSGRLSGSLRLSRPAAGWMPYFLGPGDQVQLAGDRVTFDLFGEPLGKGFTLLGVDGGIETMELRLEGESVRPNRVLLGPGRPWSGAALSADRLLVDTGTAQHVPGRAVGGGEPPLLHLFRRAGTRARVPENPETRKRLLALGYLQ